MGAGGGAGGETAALSLASSMAGRTPYNMASGDNFSPSGIDCSGLVSAEVNAFVGDSPFSSRMSTPVEADWLRQRGFVDGVGGEGTLRVGWYDHGGGEYGHTAMTLPDGTNVESTTGNGFNGVRMGSSARGAADGLFDHHMYLPIPGSGPARGGGAGGSRMGGFSRGMGMPLAPPTPSPNPPPVITDKSGNSYVAGSSGGGAIAGMPVPDNSGVDISADFPRPIQFPNVDIPDTPPTVGGAAAPAASVPVPDFPYTPFSPVNMPTVGYNKAGEPMSGAYGGITAEQATRDAEEVQQRQHEKERAQAEVNDISAKIAAAKQAGDDATKLHTLNEQLQQALWGQNKATQDLTDAQTKQSNDWNKIASSSSSGGKSSKDASMGSQLGSGLMKGIGQELGFGDLFGKPPWEWGLWKLGAGLASWGIGEANAYGDASSGGGGGGGGAPGGGGGGSGLGGMLGGLLSGAGKSAGINPAVSTPNVSGAPNVMPTSGNLAESRPDNAPILPPGQVSNTFNIQAQNPNDAATTFGHVTNSSGFQSSMGTAGVGPVANG